MSDDATHQQLTVFAGDFHAKTFPLPESARDWLESEAGFGSSSIAFLTSLGRDGLLSKMSPAYYPATTDETLPRSFAGWSNSSMASYGGFLTLSTSEWPNDGDVCSLSEVLETDVAPKYYLSARACRGILRRAAKRGKELPDALLQALQAVARTQEP